MKIIGLTTITNPHDRQDPWIESISQMSEVLDYVIVVCGKEEDVIGVDIKFEDRNNVFPTYLEWPQPIWTFDELPRHLNFGMEFINTVDNGCDWMMKFDIDTVIHEDDKDLLRKQLREFSDQNVLLARIEKYQFHLATQAREKGKIPLFINLKHKKQVIYGSDKNKYTDLCQPIISNGESIKLLNAKNDIPVGFSVEAEFIKDLSGVHVWNYDYTFKTEQKARELLYNFELSHQACFGAGQYGLIGFDITGENALNKFLNMIISRASNAPYKFEADKHPKHFIQKIKNIKPDQLGFNLWGNLKTK